MHAAAPDPPTARDRSPLVPLPIDAQRDVRSDRLTVRLPSFPADVVRLLVGSDRPPAVVARGRHRAVLDARLSGGGPT